MADFTLWSVIASPYLLKMQSSVDYAGHNWQRWPDQSTWPSGLKMMRNLNKARKLGLVQRFPERVRGMDEYPAVPFYTEDGTQFFYDSSGLALHLDQHADRHESPLLPTDPALAFVCRLRVLRRGFAVRLLRHPGRGFLRHTNFARWPRARRAI